MNIGKAKYQNDIRDAYIRGIEFGFELARKLKEVMNQKEAASMSDQHQLEEFSLLLQQLLEIARTKEVDLE